MHDEEDQEALEEPASTDSDGCAPVTLVCLPADTARSTSLPVADINASGFVGACLLGDPFDNLAAQEAEEQYSVNSWGVYCASRLHNDPNALCRNAGLFLGWNDSRLGSDVDVRSEEVTHKQYLHDMKKYNKKYNSKKGSHKNPPPVPVHNRPKISRSLENLVQVFPTKYAEDGPIRSMHKVTKVGPEVEIFELDARGNYLPKSQIKWLKEALSASSAQWKIVLTGVPVSLGWNIEATGATAHRKHHQSILGDVQNTTEAEDQVTIATVGQDKNKDGKTVTMTTPSTHKDHKEEHNDVDEQGRDRNSLQYVVASLQRSHERRLAALKADDADDSVDDGTVPDETETATVVTAGSDRKDPSEEVCVESGIVFVTSVSAHSGLVHAPYVSTFDPSETGKVYSVEVSVGSSILSASASDSKSEGDITIIPNMGTRFIDNESVINSRGSNTDAAADHAAVVKLEKNGDLSITILRLASSTHPDESTAPTEVKKMTFKPTATEE